MPRIRFNGITKSFGDHQVIKAFSADVPDNEFLVLLGPSGCGKSTMLRMIAGLTDITTGQLEFDGTVVNGTEPKERDIAFVFQSYALYPHLTVRANIAFPLLMSRFKPYHHLPVVNTLMRRRVLRDPEVDAQVRRVAEMMELTDYLDRRPRTLSGGQRQRVAVGRALIREPSVYLLDEPLSNLDAMLRSQMRAEITALHQRVGKSFVYVTHDQVEAMAMGDRVVVMNHGRVRQIGTPAQVYDEPADTFVATFLGSPPMNLVTGAAGITGFRPEHFLPAGAAPAGDALTQRFRFSHEEYLGAERILYGALTGGLFDGAKVVSRIASTHAALFQSGADYDFAVEKRHLKLFDPATGLRRA